MRPRSSSPGPQPATPTLLSPRAAPTSTHPLVRDADLTEMVLALRFVHDLRLLERVETEVVGRACAGLAAGELFSAPSRIREQVDRIASSEAEQVAEIRALLDHALAIGPRRLQVAMGQPPMPSFVDAVHAIAQTEQRPSLVYLFAAVIAEILGGERLIASDRGADVEPRVSAFLLDHAREEREHAAVFADVCRIAWIALDDGDRASALRFVPRLLDCYIIPSRATCVAILDDAGVDWEDAETVFLETYTRWRLARIIAPLAAVAVRVFARAGMLDSASGRRAFGSYVQSRLP